MRVTEQRKRLGQILIEAKQLMTCIDIYKEMTKHYPGLSYNTVYSNVRIFKERNIIEQFVIGENICYRLYCREHRQHHYHIICLNCEDTIPVDFSPELLKICFPNNFIPTQYKFDVYGYCAVCEPVAND